MVITMNDISQPLNTTRTLSRWIDRIIRTPNTIECPHMQMLGHDHEPPLFTGPGHIYIRSSTQIEFVMHATPQDGGEALGRLVRAQKKPYDISDQFRVLATEYDGTQWNCGWTSPKLGDASENVWRLSGSIDALLTEVSGHWVCPESSVEVVYDKKLRFPIPTNMITSVRRGEEDILWSRRPGTKKVQAAGTEIEFSHAPEHDVIWVTARTSSLFPHPYAENWISEPLRLLLGQLVFPRLVARNRGDGSAMIWVRPSPSHTAHTPTATILGEDPYCSDEFWDMYCDILTMVVHASDKSGAKNFESHPLTHYYEEIAEASTGSRWILCMTLTSVAEGVAKLLFPPAEQKSDFNPTDIENLRQHIKQWKGDSNLRSRILNSLAYAETKGIVQSMNTLCLSGALDSKEVDAWKTVRNHVMHGNLVPRWMDEELEQQLERLIKLTHGLSEAYVRKCISDVEKSL